MPSAIEHQLSEVGAKIQRGRKLFLLHNNPDGFLGVNWQGKYHLAYILEGWNPATNQFRVLWNRKGKSSQTVETLQYKDQVLEIDTVQNVTVDDDSHHGILWTAEVVDLLQDDFINVKVRWERGDVQKVYLSRLSIGLKSRRKRNLTNMLGFDKKVTMRNVAAAKGRKPLSKNDEVISIASSSSEDDSHKESERNSNKFEKEEENEKKPPAFVAFNPIQFSASAPSSSSDDNNNNSESLRQSSGGRSGVSSTSDEDITVRKRARVSVPRTAVSSQRITAVRGFTEISLQIKEDIPETVVNILTGLDEVERGSEEYIETLKDAVALLQEELFQLNDNTEFINAPLEAKPIHNESRDNKDRIVYMAKTTFKLQDSQIAELFEKHLKNDDNGIYSIHDAIPILQRMSDEFRVLRIDFEANENENKSGDEDELESDVSIGSGSAEDITRRNFQLLGKRIKTTFEDGKEYEGNVTAVHYRVQYDDKENESMSRSEVMQNLADNDVVIGSSSMKEVDLSSLEIFSGCSLLSNYCERKGMEALSIDKDVDSNATIKADFFNEGVQDILAKRTNDFIHASPECKFYSHMMGAKHRDKYNYNKTPEAHHADAMLLNLFYFFEKELRKNKDVTLTLENPAAWMMKGNIMTQLFEGKLNMRPYKIYYCQFGRGEKKPTCIWTNDPCLGRILVQMGGVCDCRGNHEESVQGSIHKKNFAALPTKLCNVISDYVYTKHRQLKYKKYIEKLEATLQKL
eukprot:scaffold307_cov146-Skeletonema_menzelii.AAC.7